MMKYSVRKEEIKGGHECHGTCLDTPKAAAERKKLPKGVHCSFDWGRVTLLVSVPPGMITIVVTNRTKRYRGGGSGIRV